MPVLVGPQSEDLGEEVSTDETIVHSHSRGQSYCLVTLFNDQEDDEDGGPYSCLFCNLVVDYPEGTTPDHLYYYDIGKDEYVCIRCKYSSDDESVVKGHYTRTHVDGDETDVTPEDLGATGGAEYQISLNTETGEYECDVGDCDYSNEDEANVKRHQTQIHGEE